MLIAPAGAAASQSAGVVSPHDARPPAPIGASAGVDLPFIRVGSLTKVYPGFTTDAEQAIHAAEATPQMQAIHRRHHPLTVIPVIYQGPHWGIDFIKGQSTLAEVDVSPSGHVTEVNPGPLAIAPYTRGHYAPMFDSPWVVVTFSLLFLVPFLDPRRLRRLVTLDAVAVLSLLISYWLFDHRHLEAAVWALYPPLVYLAVRMARLGLRRRRPGERFSSPLSMRTLGIGLLVLVVARTALGLLDHQVIDVGYASVIGAHRAAHGEPLYYATLTHPDTYGPIAYLAYLPFEAIFPWRGQWDYLASAHVASAVFDLITIFGLVLLGRRLAPGAAGRRLGLVLAWAWSACPFTLLGLMEHTNDGLVAMLSVLALLAFASPGARGALLGLAAAAKFSPAALLPLFAGGRRLGRRDFVVCVAVFTFVVVAAIGLYLPPGGLSEFYDHTLGFQFTRIDVFSPWALHPGLAPVKTALELVALVFAVGIALNRRERSMVQVCALAAAVTIAVELPAIHWFYFYVIWFLPFTLVAGLAPAAAPVPVAEAVSVRRRAQSIPSLPEPAPAAI